MRRVAWDAGMPAYLVGGPVRDALLGAPVLDLDFAVEGDAIGLARRVGEALGGRVTAHARFGTATVEAAGGRMDLVTARREAYPRPGELPRVTPGSIADDLARRDFSINAMAFPLWPSNAEMLDPHGGFDDLAAGVVRSLHRRSFVDDPTRLLRAVRYEGRFGFRIERDTLTDMAACVAAGCMDAVSGDRWRHELERIFEEASPGPALLRASELGLLAGIHPSFRDNGAETENRLRRLSALPAGAARADDWLAALFSPLTAAEGERVMQRIRLSGRRAALARDTIMVREWEPEIRAAAGRPSDLAGMLSALEPGAVSAWAMLTDDPPVAAALQRYTGELRHVRPRLSGDALLAMGVPQGPMVGEILAKLRDARLDGLTDSRKSEEALVRELLCRPKTN